LITLPI